MTQKELEHRKNELKTEIDIAKQLLNENVKDFQVSDYLSNVDIVKSIATPMRENPGVAMDIARRLANMFLAKNNTLRLLLGYFGVYKVAKKTLD